MLFLHDTPAAEDVVHDVFVNFTRNISAFRLTGKLKNYLAVCATNEARALLRRRKTRARHRDLAYEPQAEALPCPVELKESTDRLRTYLAQLPVDQREVIVLRIKADLKFKDIARIQQTTLSTVQGRYRYGIKKLRGLCNGELNQ